MRPDSITPVLGRGQPVAVNKVAERVVVSDHFTVVSRQGGYLLRDVINKVSGIHFGSSEQVHTLGALYETMLREMRDAAGDSVAGG